MTPPGVSDRVHAAVDRAAEGLQQQFEHEGGDSPQSLLSGSPRPSKIVEVQRILLDALIPGRVSGAEIDDIPTFVRNRLREAAGILLPEISRALTFQHAATDPPAPDAESIVVRFLEEMPAIRAALIDDVRAAYYGDPAALSYAEVKVAYPGLVAVTSHRIAHELYRLGVPIVPRVMSEWTHSKTGIDIHPGARIGSGFFIDHGTGVVIGETTEIGDRVKIYQGVTLGAKSFALDELGRPVKSVKRHPTVHSDVIIYANAIILGGDTVIGAGSTIGGGVFLIESVPPGSLVVAKQPELHIKRGDQSV